MFKGEIGPLFWRTASSSEKIEPIFSYVWKNGFYTYEDLNMFRFYGLNTPVQRIRELESKQLVQTLTINTLLDVLRTTLPVGTNFPENINVLNGLLMPTPTAPPQALMGPTRALRSGSSNGSRRLATSQTEPMDQKTLERIREMSGGVLIERLLREERRAANA